MSIDTLLGDIDTIIEEGKSVPFSSKLMIDVEELKRVVEDIRLGMPEEITQAKKIASERRDILNDAQSTADDIVNKARQRADLMVEEHQITKEAKEAALGIMQQAKDESSTLLQNARSKAQDMMDRAEKWSNDMRENASSYVEDIVRSTDETLTKNVNDIRKLRQNLREALGRSAGDDKPNLD